MESLLSKTSFRCRTHKNGKMVSLFWDCLLPNGQNVVLMKGELLPAIAEYLLSHLGFTVHYEHDGHDWPVAPPSATLEKQLALEQEILTWEED